MATQSDQTNTGVITTIVVVGAFAMITISAMVTALVRSQHAQLDAERPTNADLDTIAALDRSQLEHLTAPPAWLGDKGSGKVHIPIERAMQLVVDEYKTKPEAASPPPPPGMVMPPSTPAPAAGSPNLSAPGAPQPTPAMPSAAVPSPAAPDPASTPRVVPPPTAPGPVPAPAPTRRP
jgi:hypothetical protein